ncbi:hypothetical protein BN1804_01652 [Proteus penneri]|uniref:Uncharacterized protein n=1 Tax=Proteus penneri TaxID=102862 RepID=A0A0G4Q7D4_9GAMM|nr:hypothetical protein BN1804_01652 [Proteus penneri]
MGWIIGIIIFLLWCPLFLNLAIVMFVTLVLKGNITHGLLTVKNNTYAQIVIQK